MTKKYVKFECIREMPKTKVYAVLSTKKSVPISGVIPRHEILGSIYWVFGWRQYVFEAESGTIWSRGCLQEIQDFINKLMEERKKK